MPGVWETRQNRRNRDFAAPHAASCAAPPPRQAAVARHRVRGAQYDVGISQTCAHAARMGAGNTPESPELEVVVVRADQGELTKLPGIATFSSLVSLGVVHDQQRAPYDVGS